MRKGSILQLALLGVVVGALASLVAYFVPWLPTSASDQSGRIDTLFWFVTAICLSLFTIVVTVLLYSVVKFRARPDDESDGPPIHGHTGLEVVWTAIPTALVTAIAVTSAIVLSKNGNAGTRPLEVHVVARQFEFTFSYPQLGKFSSPVLALPLDRPAELSLTSPDVIHGFWVPEFGQKQDAVPGITTHIVITPNRLGTYPVECTQLCGLGHALMRTSAIVMRPADFETWASKQAKGASAGAAAGQSGKAVFTSNGCGACHTLAAAGSTGTVGPDLDKLPQEAKGAGQPLEAFVRESIVKPNAYVAPGYPASVMPETFGSLPKAQLDALVQFLVESSKKGTS